MSRPSSRTQQFLALHKGEAMIVPTYRERIAVLNLASRKRIKIISGKLNGQGWVILRLSRRGKNRPPAKPVFTVPVTRTEFQQLPTHIRRRALRAMAERAAKET